MAGKATSGGKVVPLGARGKRKAKAPKVDSKPKSSRPGTSLTHEQIAKRAEAIWHKRGCPAGQDEQNWHEAEAQLRAELGIE